LNKTGYKVQERVKPRKIINGFNFHHEFDQLKIRMHELYDVVDYFILTEGKYTHYGKPKPLLFRSNMYDFKEFLSKIIDTVVDDYLPTLQHEYYMRNQIGRLGLPRVPDLRDDDLLIINDADEIVSSSLIAFLKTHDGFPDHIAFTYRWTYYGYFWHNPKPTIISAASTINYFRTMLSYCAQNIRDKPPHFTFGSYENFVGWHCSWCFPVKDWPAKLNAARAGDGERWGDHGGFQDVELLKQYRYSGQWFDGSKYGNLTSPDEKMFAPKWVLKNQKEMGYLVSRDIDPPFSQNNQTIIRPQP